MVEPTPENTSVLGPRIIAQVLDNAFNAALIYGGVLLVAVDATLGLLAIVLGVIVALGHYFLAEAFWDGRTIGKQAMNISVVRKDGSPCTVGRSLIRNLLQIIDVLPALWIIGILSISVTEYNQRVGDLVAGTVVVEDGG